MCAGSQERVAGMGLQARAFVLVLAMGLAGIVAEVEGRRRMRLGGLRVPGGRLSSWGFWLAWARTLGLGVGLLGSCRGRCLGSRLLRRIGLRAGWCG